MILPVINIGTGYQIGHNVVITHWQQGINNLPSWLWRTTSFITGSHAHMFYDRPAFQAEARTFFFFFFFFFFCLSAQHPQSDRVYPRCAILQQGMHLNVFSKVYCDRVYFSCADAIWQGQVLTPPPSGTPVSSWEVECPPPPRGGGRNGYPMWTV